MLPNAEPRRRLGNTPLFLLTQHLNIPFSLLLLAGTVLLCRVLWNRLRGRALLRLRASRLDRCVILACCFCAAMALLFMQYVNMECPMSEARRAANRELAVRVMQALQAAVPGQWWPDFGSLLAVLRESEIMPWDPDADLVLMMKRADTSAGANRSFSR